MLWLYNNEPSAFRLLSLQALHHYAILSSTWYTVSQEKDSLIHGTNSSAFMSSLETKLMNSGLNVFFFVPQSMPCVPLSDLLKPTITYTNLLHLYIQPTSLHCLSLLFFLLSVTFSSSPSFLLIGGFGWFPSLLHWFGRQSITLWGLWRER